MNKKNVLYDNLYYKKNKLTLQREIVQNNKEILI